MKDSRAIRHAAIIFAAAITTGTLGHYLPSEQGAVGIVVIIVAVIFAILGGVASVSEET